MAMCNKCAVALYAMLLDDKAVENYLQQCPDAETFHHRHFLPASSEVDGNLVDTQRIHPHEQWQTAIVYPEQGSNSAAWKIVPAALFTPDISGAAVRAERDFVRGEIIYGLQAKRLPLCQKKCDEIGKADLDLSRGKYTGQRVESMVIGPARFLNNLCLRHNSEFIFPRTGIVGVRAVRDISAGDQITVDYGRDYWAPGECKCSTCMVREDTAG